MTISPLLQSLDQAADGLLFRSETASPFDAIHWPKSGLADLSKDRLLPFLKKPADTVYEEITLDYFFRNVSKVQDWQDDDVKLEVGRYQKLIAALRDNLTNIRVLRVGKVEVDVYIVGETQSGDWAGLHTLVVET